MKYSFKPGDIVVLKETENRIGWLDVSMLPDDSKEKFKSKYRKWRAGFVKIIEDRFDKDGDPLARIRRLDTKAHGLETYSQGLLAHAEGD